PALDAYLAWVVDSTSVKGLVDAVGSAAPGVWQKLDAGDVEGAVTDGLAAVMGSGSLRQAFLQWIGDTAFGSVANASKLADQVTQYVGAFGGVDGAAANMDLLLAAAGWLEANGADKWDVDGGWVTVSLEPNYTMITYFQDVALKTELSTTVGSGVELFYVYKSFGPSGAFFTGATPNPYQTEFETDKDAILYNAINGVKHEANVARVDVYLVDGGEKMYLGTGEAKIKVDEPPVMISPPIVTVNKNEYPLLTCKVSGIAGPFFYKWSGKRRAPGEGLRIREVGTTDWLNKVENDTARKIQVGRIGGYEGELTVYVTVYQGGVEIGTGECHVTLNRYSVSGTAMGYAERDADGSGSVYYGVDFPKVDGAAGYHVNGIGFNDPLYYGDFRETVFSARDFLVHLRDRGATYFHKLISINGDLGTKSTEEYIAEMAWRFEGGEWEVIPQF
ncbi:MAG: hypothetical protein JXQ73_23345, partial [Phycisphaerae bacterium]|nr:hypothetical protein [Phycisphaerae bacterium]